MKELQELRNEILTLRNFGVINKEEEKSLLTKLNSVKEQFALSGIVSSVPNKALKDSVLSDMIEGYKIICKPDANFEKYYSKGFTECWEWIKRLTK